MAKLRTILVCLAVLTVIVSSTLAAEQAGRKQNRNRKTEAGKPKKRPQADAPLPSKKKCM